MQPHTMVHAMISHDPVRIWRRLDALQVLFWLVVAAVDQSEQAFVMPRGQKDHAIEAVESRCHP